MIKSIFVTLLLTWSINLCADEADPDTPIPNGFVGDWIGVLTVQHAPTFSNAPGTLKYRLKISGSEVRAFLWEKKWVEIDILDIVSVNDSHGLFVLSRTTPHWVEDFSFSVVLLDKDEMYVYVSRVVDNYNAPQDHRMRHFPVYLTGHLSKGTT